MTSSGGQVSHCYISGGGVIDRPEQPFRRRANTREPALRPRKIQQPRDRIADAWRLLARGPLQIPQKTLARSAQLLAERPGNAGNLAELFRRYPGPLPEQVL